MEGNPYDGPAWVLVAGWRRGIGRSWLGWVFVPDDDPAMQASASLPPLKQWVRGTVADCYSAVPQGALRYHWQRPGRMCFAYAPAKYADA